MPVDGISESLDDGRSMLTQNETSLEGPLTIERTRYGDEVLVFTLAGEFDLAGAADARAMIEPALTDPDVMTVFDLTSLEFIDSSGIALLYRVAGAHADKDNLRLMPSRHPGVNRVLALTGVAATIPIVVG